MPLPVIEIFDSIQGEGSMIGTAATFIRLAGCNLKCPWCDTKISWDIEIPRKQLMCFGEIIARCNKDVVIITGGEPCLYQVELYALIELLHEVNKYVCIETNGTLCTPANADWVVCSPKPPRYYIHRNCQLNELKYVVDANFKLENIAADYLEANSPIQIWLQPQGYNMEESVPKAYQLVMENSDKLLLGVQLHKLLNFK